MLFQFILLLLTFLSQSSSFYRLSTLGQVSLKPDNYVYSTLGYFRLSLEPISCQLKIDYFDDTLNQNSYKTQGYYPKSNGMQCQELILNESGLFTQKGKNIFFFRNQLTNNQSQQDFIKSIKQTFLTIDDTGVVRLQSIFTDLSTRQKWITNFRIPQKYLYASNNKIISVTSALPILKNTGDWGFSASKSEFRIFQLNDKTKISRYKFLPFILSTNIFKDWNDFTTPLLNFEGLKYEKRCGISKQVSFRSPFVFILNKYWPQLRILDQEGYQLFNMRFPSINCIKQIGVDILTQSQDCLQWFCPPETFELNGKCLTKCPTPYFHQTKENNKNRCLLICQAGSQIDNLTNICTCAQRSVFICPYNMTPTPFGCLCKNKRYFFNMNSIESLNNRPLDQICMKNCPSRYFQHSDGICLSCPFFCLKCIVSNNSMSFLRCLQCDQGYEIFNFYCRKKCELKVGNYLNQTNFNCQTCKIKYCRRCQMYDKNQRCNECMLPYVLSNNSCLNSCPKGSLLNFVNDKYFSCFVINQCSSLVSTQKFSQINMCKSCGNKDFCFQSCDDNLYQYFHNKSSCFCLDNTTTSYMLYCNYSLIDERKTKINSSNFLQNNPCPIMLYYFDYRTNQCLKCPFGCLTCIISEKGLPQCTSCVQNYYLSVYDSNYCQKQTSLAYCYSFNRNQKYCFSWDNIVVELQKELNHWLCKKIDPNCFICMYKSLVYCKFCQNNYYLHQGKCIEACPQEYYPYKYQRICLPKVIDNCLQQNIQSTNYLINSNSNTQYTQGYRYFTSKYFTQIQNQNDPIGLIFVYSSYLKKKIDGQRMSTFTQAVPKCKSCKKGYGLTINRTCQKCSSHCQFCLFSFIFSCLKCHPFYYLSDQRQCIPLQQSKRPCLNGQFRAQNNICQNQCSQFQKISSNQLLFDQNQKLINCTYNCPDSMTIMKNTIGDIYCIQSILKYQDLIHLGSNLGINLSDLQQIKGNQIKMTGSCYKGQEDLCIIIPTQRIITNSKLNNIKIQLLTTSDSRILSENINSQVNFENNILVIKGLKEGVLKVVLNIQDFSDPQKNQYLGNSVYGIQIQQNGSMLDQILDKDHGIHNYSRTLVILFLLIAVINIGKSLDYKLDNTFITMGVIYLALTGSNLSLSKGSYFMFGWMYGFSWSVGLQMFSNPRLLTTNGNFISNSYIQNTKSYAHLLLFVDDNFIRNCWSIFILLFIVIGLLILFWAITNFLTRNNFCEKKRSELSMQKDQIDSGQKIKNSEQNSDQKDKFVESQTSQKMCKKVYPKVDVGHFGKIKIFSFFIIENCILGLLYYAFLQLASKQWKLTPSSQLIAHKVLGGVFLVFIIVYSLLRFYNNFTAGIYLSKRFLLSFMLFLNPLSNGPISLFLSLLCVEIFFINLRIFLECKSQVIKLAFYLNKKLHQKNLKQKQKLKDIQSGDRQGNDKQDQPKVQQAFQFQKAIISNNILNLPQQSEVNKHKNKSLASPKSTKINMVEKQPTIWSEMSHQIKTLLFEQFLIILVYLMIALSELVPEVSVFIIFVVFMIFLVSLVDELIVNLIEYTQITTKKLTMTENSLISQLNNKLNLKKYKYYFKIRNNFDYESETKNSFNTDFSTISARDKRSTLSTSYIHSVI